MSADTGGSGFADSHDLNADLRRLRARSALFDLVHLELSAVRQTVEAVRRSVEAEDVRLVRLGYVVEGLGGVEGAYSLLAEINVLRRRLWSPGLDLDGL